MSNFETDINFNLDWLIGPINKNLFFEKYWEKEPLWIDRKNDRDFFDQLINISNVDNIITTQHHQPFTIVLNQQILPRPYYNQGEDKEKIIEFFNSGGTLLLDNIEKSWKPLKSLCNEVEKELQVCQFVFCNLFFSPPDSQAFEVHADNQDVFILQIEGSKNWTIYEPDFELPIHDEQAQLEPDFEKNHDPLYELNLKKGDLIYIPKGFPHRVQTSNDLSIHITFTIINYTLYDYYAILLRELSNENKNLRKSLNKSFFRNDTLEIGLSEIINEANIKKSKDILRKKIIDKQKPLYKGAFVDIHRKQMISTQTKLKARENLDVHINETDKGISVSSNGGTFSLEVNGLKTAFEFIFSNSTFTVGAIPGELDDEDKIGLVQSLIEGGMISIIDL